MRKQQRLVIDEKVEVRSTDDGFLGSWHSGTVVSSQKGIRLVLYDHLLSDNNDKLIDSVKVNNVLDGFDCTVVVDCCFRGLIRPLSPSPLVDFDMWGVKYGQCVDVYYRDAWWEGVIFDQSDGVKERSVFFPDIGDELMADVSDMRVSQDWDEGSGVWKMRGKWLFLELIDEFEKEFWPIVVSIKQIWYDVRVKKGFVENVKEWTCLKSDAWRGLLEEVLADNFKLTVKELYGELEISGVKGLEECSQILELNGSDLIKRKPFDEISGDQVLSVADSDRLDMLPLSSSVKPTVEDEAGHGLCAKYDDSCNNSHNVSKKSGHHIWFLADFAPKCCDDAIEVYFNYKSSKNKKTPHEVAVNLRRHLLFLGWKVEYFQKEGFRRWRYTQPDADEKCFNSLVKVCMQIKKSDSASRFPLDDQNRLSDDQNGLPDASDSMVLTPLAEKSQGCKNERVKNSLHMLEYEYCPQAVINYYSLSINETIHPKDHDKLKDMQLKAKKHLSAVGWKLYPVYRNDRKSKELKYRSPWGKLYCSLRTACKGFLDENRNVWKLADAQLAGEGPCSTIATKDFDGKHEKKRKSNAQHLASCPRPPKSLKKKSNFMDVQARDDLNYPISNHVLGTRKSAREEVVPSSNLRNPRTILSWLVDNNMVSVKDKVLYQKDGIAMAEGRVTGAGIKCKCCKEIFSVSNFEVHATGTRSQPSANIFLCKNGKSLQQCQIELRAKINEEVELTRKINEEVTGKQQQHQNNEDKDDICSVCHSYGTLILCDHCPCAFHSRCLGLKENPDDTVWFCPSCCCRICGGGEESGHSKVSPDISFINCNQCERRYHINCLRLKDLVPDSYPKGYWFCNKKCEQISFALQKLLGKPVQVGTDGLSWTLLKYVNPYESDQDLSDIANSTENYSKLNVALGVMHECFEHVEQPCTRSDLVKDVIFNRWSKINRLNFRGFYTVLLEKNDELISAVIVRIYGEKVAEIPLVATRFLYQRRGMCRILLNEFEKVLKELGVERLLLPAVPSLLNTWTSSFGFSVMPQSDRLKLLDYTFLNFEGTIMCQKLL